MNSPSPRLRHASPVVRRGSAMVETVLALPVILLMLVAVIGFGVATKRFAPLQNAARYDAWRRTTPGAPGPAADDQLRAAFYPKDTPVSLVRGGGNTALAPQVDAALTQDLSDDPRLLADDIVNRFPRDFTSTVTAQHDSTLPLFSKIGFTSPVTRTASRLNGDWRYMDGIRHLGQPWAAYPDGWDPLSAGPRVSASLQEQFLQSLDGAMPSAGGTVGGAVQGLYAWNPGYVGPNWILNPEWFPPGVTDDQGQ